jgi:HSP20 family molecular chaperone IbpA
MKIFWVWHDDNHHNHHDDESHEIHGHEGWEHWEEENIWQVAVDIIETDEILSIIAPIAWVDFADIDISLNKNILTIRGKRSIPEIYHEERVIVRNKECFWWEFVRNIILPENLDFDSIEAQMHNNLLMVSIEKLRFNTQNIKINRLTD